MVDFARVQGGRQIQTGGILVLFRGFEFGAQRRNRVKDAVYGWTRTRVRSVHRAQTSRVLCFAQIMRLIKKHNYNGITGYQLGWSILGPPLMTVYCYVFDDVMLDTAQGHMRKEALQIASQHKIKRIFLTHYHEDHSGNADSIKQEFSANVYGHPITKEKMSSSFKILPYQKYVWGKANLSNIEILPEKIETALGVMTPIHTPGHSDDHTAYLIKDAGVLFSGDIYLADKIKLFRSDENIGDQIESLKKILSLDFDALLCCHSPKSQEGKKHINRKLNFLEDFYGNIIYLYQKGLSEKQIFRSLNLKEDNFRRFFSFGDICMINGVRSAIRYHNNKTRD
jgi:glyoxylase-like metal-dependent hydrolase (beta-lactamase superfamily II)